MSIQFRLTGQSIVKQYTAVDGTPMLHYYRLSDFRRAAKSYGDIKPDTLVNQYGDMVPAFCAVYLTMEPYRVVRCR